MDTTPEHQEAVGGSDALADLIAADPADAPDFADAIADALARRLADVDASGEAGGAPS